MKEWREWRTCQFFVVVLNFAWTLFAQRLGLTLGMLCETKSCEIRLGKW